MTLQLFGHPLSSYSMKVLIALYENATPFAFRMLSPEEPANGVELAGLWPLGKFPVLVDEGRVVGEASVIVEYLDVRHPGPVALIPVAMDAAIEARMLDRVFDNYVMGPLGAMVADALRPGDARDAGVVKGAQAMLDRSYAWLDGVLADRVWAAGEAFSLADCAAAPALLYADWAHPIPETLAALRAYRARLLARPSFARCVDEARPYRAMFPLGAPDRD